MYEESKVLPFQPAKRAVLQYQQNVEVNLSPVEILIKMYDAAIFSLQKKDTEKATKAINELILALNFNKSNPQNVREVAEGFLRIYEFCKICIKKNNLQDAINALQEIRNAWELSIQNQHLENTESLN